jgi:hypothetical protein
VKTNWISRHFLSKLFVYFFVLLSSCLPSHQPIFNVRAQPRTCVKAHTGRGPSLQTELVHLQVVVVCDDDDDGRCVVWSGMSLQAAKRTRHDALA